MKIINVVGARPNFMKIAPVHQALRQAGHHVRLVHTGQHYDATMSQVFFDELGMPPPDINLHVGPGSHAVQTARVMQAFEPVIDAMAPDWVVVAGDVNSSLACALVAAKKAVKVAHLEAGLRSADRSMPEEINRVLIDQLSDVLLTPSADADANLRHEGIAAARIHCVGNAMIDSLRQHEPQARARAGTLLSSLGITAQAYALVTLHRPANVDDPARLGRLWGALRHLSEALPVIFPVHPRTRENLQHLPPGQHVLLLAPLGYLDFLALQMHARMVLTDSGGMQEETTALGVPCLTLRENTERPVTVQLGTNTLVGLDPAVILQVARQILQDGGKVGRIPPLWDGHTAGRVVAVLQGHEAAA